MLSALLLMLGVLVLPPALPCTGDAELTPECQEIELERVTTAYLKAALEPGFLDSLVTDPSPEARLVGSMLLDFPPNFDQDPSAAPSEQAVDRAKRALSDLLDDHPDHLLARIVALNNCASCDAACGEQHAEALRRYFPDAAIGYLFGAHYQWLAGEQAGALHFLRHAGTAATFGAGFGALVRVIHDALDRLPPNVDDDPYDRRDLALYQIGFSLAAGLQVPYLKTLQEICLEPGDPEAVAACLSGTRALSLPGRSLVHSSIGLTIERSIYDAIGDSHNLDRAITRTAVLHECAEAVSVGAWQRDPAAMAAYVEELEHHGECPALDRAR